MARNSGYRLLLVLISVTIVCLVMTAFHRFMNDSMLFGVECCRNLSKLLPVVAASWLVVIVRTVTFATLMVSFGLLFQRLWRTYRFVAQLKAAFSAEANAFAPARLVTLCAELGLLHQVMPLATPTPLAFCCGLFKPRIWISTGLVNALSDQELKAVLLHEAFHCRRYDPLRTLLIDSVATALFFLPASAEWRDLFLTSIELAADRHAMRLSGRFSLAGALHKLLTHPLAMQFSATSIAGIIGISATDARLAQLLDNAPIHFHFSPRNLISSSLILILVCMALQIAQS